MSSVVSSDSIIFFTDSPSYPQFSNFFTHSDRTALFELDGLPYLSSEHYYQASKFDISGDKGDIIIERPSLAPVTLRDYVKEIRTAPDPKTAAGLGRDKIVAPYFHNDWKDDRQNDVMLRVLRAKFGVFPDCDHDPELEKLLRQTVGQVIIEFSAKGDKIWGVDSTGEGENRLGQMLSHVCAELISGKINDFTSMPKRQWCTPNEIAKSALLPLRT